MEVLQMCHCCLQRPPDMDLKTPYAYLDKTVKYSDMIKNCFEINLSLGSYDCGICNVCVARLLDAHEFKLQVQRVQNDLQALLAADAKTTVKLERNDDGSGDDGRPYEELEIDFTLDHIKSEDCLTKIEVAVKKEVQDEGEGDEDMKLNEDMPKPLSIERSEGQRAKLRVRVHTERDRKCAKQVFLTGNLSHPIPITGNSPPTIPLTGNLPATIPITGNIPAPIPGQSGKSFTCDVCGKNFKQNELLIEHKRIHTEKLLPCQQSLDIGTLRRQMLEEYNRRYSCKECGKAFPTNCSLVRHTRSHTGEKPFSCDICNARFSLQGSLKRHRAIHTGDAPYTCDVCAKSFTYSDSLKDHRRVHAGETPF